MTAFINGDLAILKIKRSAVFVPLACLTNNSLSENWTFNDVQTKCDPGVILSTPKAYSYSHAIEGLLIDSTSATGDTAKASWDYINGLMRAGTEIDWQIDIGGIVTDSGKGYFENLELSSPVGDNITFTGSIKGTGDITSTP